MIASVTRRGLLRLLELVAGALPPRVQVAHDLLVMDRSRIRALASGATLRPPPVGLAVRRPRSTHLRVALEVRPLVLVPRLERRDTRGAASNNGVVWGEAL